MIIEKRFPFFIAFLISAFVFIQCKSDQVLTDDLFRLNVRLADDPGRLCPIFASNIAAAREVYPYLFLQLGEYNPETLSLSPILAKSVPEPTTIIEGKNKGGIRIEYEILPDAVWVDGSPITAEDYLFTLKAVGLPIVNAELWRNSLSKITEVNILSDDKKKFEVIFKEDYSSALELSISIEFLPSHLYDKEGSLGKIPLSDFYNKEKIDQIIAQDSSLVRFAENFNDREFHVNLSSGSGPYTLSEWRTDQYILLSKKENWWGSNYPERPFLRGYPDEILFQIVPDETTALTLLKDGSLDVMTIKVTENFTNINADAQLSEKLEFHTPQLTNYYYIALNNRNPFLSDKRVRKALAHIIDVDNLIETQEANQGKRTVGIVPPFRPEYNKTLTPIEYDIAKARDLLQEAGWSDTDEDQILDKVIDGERKNLSLTFHVFKSTLGQRIGLIAKESAKKVGIDIEIIQIEFRTFFRNNWKNFDYDMAPMRRVLQVSKTDPYNVWHSDNAKINGGNTIGYVNKEIDRLIEDINNTEDEKESDQYFRKIQEIMYEDQPCIFLYSPVSRIITSKRVEPLISVKRPGYFVNSFQMAKTSAFSNN